MPDVLLATCADLPDGEDGGHLLVEELAARGLTAAWAAWDDHNVEWASARVVAVRSTWDYESRRDQFLDWAREVEARTRLVNPAGALEWNTDKAYLVGLGEHLPVVPTVAVEDEEGLRQALGLFRPAVVKPRVGAGGRGVVVLDGWGAEAAAGSRLAPGPWVVQPLVASVRTEGETSVFVLGGRAVAQVRKLPASGEIRVHEEYGGLSVAVDLDPQAVDLACTVVATVERLLQTSLPVARVDLMRLDHGRLGLSELEVTEPGLYLDIVPQTAAAFAETVSGLL